MRQESVPITPQNLRVICDQCVARAVVHYVGDQHGLERIVRIECHGVQRLVHLAHYAQRVAELATPGEVHMLWSQLPDVVSDCNLREYLADLVANVDRVRAMEPPTPGVPGAAEWPAERDEYVRGRVALAEHVRAVMRSRCGETP